jgi:LacI family transcriptional regulator
MPDRGNAARNGLRYRTAITEAADAADGDFCTNNKLFLGLVRAVNQAGIRCPEEVSLVGYDDLAWTENFHPRLTTIAQPTRDLGRRAMRLETRFML